MIRLTREQYERLKDNRLVAKRVALEGVEIIGEAPIKPNAPSPWSKVKAKWELATAFANAAGSRGAIATIAQAIGVSDTMGERVSPDILERRKQSCLSCDQLKKVGAQHFCGACGCPHNELAAISDDDHPERFTKLEYPYLECPQRRDGFSNSVSGARLAVIMPVFNDMEEALATCRSIRDTAPAHVEIIAVDDGSDPPLASNTQFAELNVHILRNDVRQGPGRARHKGAESTTAEHLLLIDSHMRFGKNWFIRAMARVVDTPTTVWCAACLGLDDSNMDISWPNVAVYTGARLAIIEGRYVLEGIWKDHKGDNCEIACLMGACYFFHRSWFFHIGGLSWNRMYGSEEPVLSLKTWLAGGEVRLMKAVRIGHKFKTTKNYDGDPVTEWYNKIRPMLTIFPRVPFEYVKARMPQSPDMQRALQLIQQDRKEILAEREYNRRIFKFDLDWYCRKFNISQPWKT